MKRYVLWFVMNTALVYLLWRGVWLGDEGAGRVFIMICWFMLIVGSIAFASEHMADTPGPLLRMEQVFDLCMFLALIYLGWWFCGIAIAIGHIGLFGHRYAYESDAKKEPA